MKNKRPLALALALLLLIQMIPAQVFAAVYSPSVSLPGNFQIMESPPVYHTATFYDWDGTQIGNQVTGILDGSLLSSIDPDPLPTRTGYTFVRWTPAETYLVGEASQNFAFTAQYRSTNLYDIRIDYKFVDGSQAALPYTARLVYGASYNVASPVVIGYVPDSATISGTATGGTPVDDIVSINHVVTYTASTGTPYKVEHYQQNINDDNYTLFETDNLTATTGATVTVNSKSYTGFTAKTPSVETVIAADGTTVVKLYYDRISYIITYDADGGTFINPFVGRYGAAVPAVTNPTRNGYNFAGWTPAPLPTTLTQSQTFTAQWTARSDVPYTLVYWIENADPNPGTTTYGYTYHSSASRTGGTAGQPVTLTNADRKTITYFTYNHFDSIIPLAGDGSTKINVYYTRNSYTVYFDLAPTWGNSPRPTLTINGTTYTDPTRYSITAKYNADISTLWPVADHVPPVTVGYRTYYFTGWQSAGIGTTFISKRLNFTSDLFSTTSSRVYTVRWQTSIVTYQLHYMVESITGGGTPYGNKNYLEELSLTQFAYTSGSSWSAKQLAGLDNIGIQQDQWQYGDGDIDVYFYYDRNAYILEYYNYNYKMGTPSFTYLYEATINPETANFTPPRPAVLPTGYTFGGWYTTPNTVPGTEFFVAGTPNTMPDNDILLYAKWNPPSYAVRFYYNDVNTGALVNHNNQSVILGNKAIRPTDPAAIPGYTFYGWDYQGTSTAFSFDTEVFGDINLQGRYIPNNNITYTVRYLRDSATGPVLSDPKTVTGQTMASIVSETAVPVTGFVPDALTKTLKLAATGNEIIFIYKATPVNYTVHYVEQGTGKVLHVPDNFSSPSNTATVTAREFTNYAYTMTDGSVIIVDFVPDQPQKTITLTSDPNQNHITFYYHMIIKYHYTVQYLEEGSNIVLATEKKVITARNSVVETPVAISDYVPSDWATSHTGAQYNVSGSSDFISTDLAVTDPNSPNPQVLTFYYSPVMTEVIGVKTWVDNGDAQGQRPTFDTLPGLALTLRANGTALATQPVPTWTNNDDNTWSYRYINLPAASGGQSITYTAREAVPNHYVAVHTDKGHPGGTNITNTLEGGTTTYAISKTWVDEKGINTFPNDLLGTLYRQGHNDPQPVEVLPKPPIEWIKVGNEWTFTFTGLKQYEAGYPVVYSATEVVPDGYIQTSAGPDFENRVVYVTATKIWNDGPSSNRPTVWFRLYRQVGSGTASPDPNAAILSLENGATSVFWRGLPQADAQGNPYTFTVREVNQSGADFVPTNYTKTESGLTVTNQYVIPTNGQATGTKTWVNGASTHPELWLQLWRKNAVSGIDEAVPGAAVIKANATGNTSHEWTGLQTTDIAGNVWTFYIKEGQWNTATTTFTEGTPINYTLTGAGSLNLTNTYVIPTTGIATATKVWADGTSVTKPNVWFKLQRRVMGSTGAFSDVPGASVHLVPASAPYTVTWNNLETTNSQAQSYEFSVVEGTFDGATFIHGSPSPFQLTAGQNTLELTNTYQSPTRTYTLTKTWAVADAAKPPVTLELWRHIPGVSGSDEKVSEHLLDGEINGTDTGAWSQTFANLPINNAQGVAYEYYAVEAVVPGNYDMTQSAAPDRLTITNTWQEVSYSAAKAWAGGYVGMLRPAVTFQLQRQSTTTPLENYLNPVILDGAADGTAGSGSGEHTAWQYTWERLPERDADNNPYTYSVVETRLEGYTPSGPVVTGGVDTITNTFEGVTINATKIIVIPNGVTPPGTLSSFTFHLNRNGQPYLQGTLNGTADTLPASGTGETAPSGTYTWHYTWGNLPRNDANGDPYTYTVTEPQLPSGYVRQSITGNMTDGFTVTNQFRRDTFRAFKYWNTTSGTSPITLQLWQQQLNAAGQVIDGSDTLMSDRDLPLDGVADVNPDDSFEEDPSITGLGWPRWHATWTGLPTTHDNGNTVKYYVKELAAIPGYDAMAGASTVITNKSQNSVLSATKTWVNGTALARPPVTFTLTRYLSDGTTLDTAYTPLTGTVDGSPDTNESPAWTYTWPPQPRYSDVAGTQAYVYKVTEATPPSYDLTGTTVSADGTHTEFTNTYVPPTKDIKLLKIWVGGAKPAVTVRLQRKLGTNGAWTYMGPGATLDGFADASVNPLTGAQEIEPWVLEGKDLPLTDENGVAYYYKVEEVTDLADFEDPVYGFNDTIDGKFYDFTVTNTYVIPTSGQAFARKEWTDGENATKPAVWFQLWRKTTTGTNDVDEAVPGVAPVNITNETGYQYTFTDLETTDSAANRYTFYVKEGTWDGTAFTASTDFGDFVYESGEGTLTLTNKYVIPTNGTAPASKTWVNGPATKPDVWFQLWRRTTTGANDVDERVPGVIPVNITQATSGTHTFGSLEETDSSGNSYTFYVVEGQWDAAASTFTPGAPTDYSLTAGAGTLHLTNTYIQPTNGTATAKKHWVNGPAGLQLPIALNLYRQVGATGTPELVQNAPDPEITGSAPSFTYTWTGLVRTNNDGDAYTFTVQEPDVVGDQITYGNDYTYTVTYNTSNTEVTNTYVIPKDGTAKGTKTWTNGPAAKPDVWFQLMRRLQGSGGNWEVVPGVAVQQVPAAPVTPLSVEWTGLDERNSAGALYEFSVREGSYDAPNFTPGSPAQYTGSGDYTATVNNAYVIPTADISAKKAWVNGPTIKPLVWFKLQRAINGGAAVDIPTGEAGSAILQLPVSGNPVSVTWENVRQSDIDGDTYTFSVVEGVLNGEDFTPGSPESFQQAAMTTELGITNTYKSPTATIKAQKNWLGGGPNNPYPTVHFQLQRRVNAAFAWAAVPGATPQAVPQPTSGTSATVDFPNIDTHDDAARAYEFRVVEGTLVGTTFTLSVPANYIKTEVELEVTNTWQTVSRSVEKNWDGGPSPAYDLPDRTATIELHSEYDGQAGTTLVSTITLDGTVNGSGSGELAPWKYTWANLPKFDDQNRELTYSVTETAWPISYTAGTPQDVANGWTITNTYQGLNITARKDYVNAPSTPPVDIILLRDGVEFDRVTLDGGIDTAAEDQPRESAPWTVSWPNLPRMKNATTEHIYTVTEELPVSDFNFIRQISGSPAAGFVITNTYRAPTLLAEKFWNLGTAPTAPSVTFKLMRETYDARSDALIGTAAYMGAAYDGIMDGTADATPGIHGSETAPWKYTWTGLEQNGNLGGDINAPVYYRYYIQEDPVPGNFIIDPNPNATGRLQVTNIAVTAPVTAEKTWVPELTGPASVYFQLSRTDGTTPTTIGLPVQLDGTADNNNGTGELSPWVYTWADMPRFGTKVENGNTVPDTSIVYTYSVTEVDVNGAPFVPDGYFVHGNSTLLITNVKNADVTATKIWDGGEAQRKTGTGPADVHFTLYRRLETEAAGDEVIVPATDLGGQSATKTVALWDTDETPDTVDVTWTNLPIGNTDGARFVYSVKETDASRNEITQWGTGSDGLSYIYKASYNADNPLEVTNTFTSPTSDRVFTKYWHGLTPGEVTPAFWVQLHRNISQDNPDQVPITGLRGMPAGFGPDPGAITFSDLPIYNPAGEPYLYTIVEYASSDGASGAPEGFRYETRGSGLHNIKLASVKATKVWANLPTDAQHPAVTLVLSATVEGELTTQKETYTVSHGTELTTEHTFTNLDTVGLNSANEYKPIAYTVDELTTPLGYDKVITGNSQDGWVVSNAYTGEDADGELADITVTKAWQDESGTPITDNAKLPAELTITLTGSDGNEYPYTLLPGEGWTHTFTNLYKVDTLSQAITYSVSETEPTGYTLVSTTGDQDSGFILTNQYDGKADNGDLTSVKVTKVWQDENGAAIKDNTLLPTELAIKLTGSDGNTYDHKLVPDATGAWTYTYADLYKVDTTGALMTYTVSETVPLGYAQLTTAGNQEDGFVLTNKYDGKDENEELVNIRIQTIWQDMNGGTLPAGALLPDSLIVTLKGTTLPDEAIPLSASGNWQAALNDRFKYAMNATLIDYSVEETVPAGFTLYANTENPVNHFTLINRYVKVWAAAMTVEKTSTATIFDKVGEVLPYVVTLRNTGDVAITNVTVTDSQVNLTSVKPQESLRADGVLAVGETWTYTYTYTVTQADLDRGHVLNTVSAASPVVPADPNDPDEDSVDIPSDQHKAMTVQKTSTATAFSAVGEKLPYTVVVTNTGSIPLDHVVVSDSQVDLSALKPVESVTADGVLAVGETWTYTYTYTITQADLDRGHVLNTASAAQPGDPNDPDDPGVPPTDDKIDIPADQIPTMTV